MLTIAKHKSYLLLGSKSNIGSMNKALVLVIPVVFLLANLANASYTLQNTNTTLTLDQHGGALVRELFTVYVSNDSVSQYSTYRIALNFTLSQWQALIGPGLEQHILNPNTGSSGFNLLPGPLQGGIANQSGGIATILLTYYVTNVTTINQTAPRLFTYTFNDDVFNFEHTPTGQVLPTHTQLNVILPQSTSKIITLFPLPDLPTVGSTQDYRNVSEFTWNSGEPLSRFTLVFEVRQSLEAEVISFFTSAYDDLGALSYVIIAAAIAGFVYYTYYKSVSHEKEDVEMQKRGRRSKR